MNDDRDVIILSRPAPPPPEVADALRRLIDHCAKDVIAKSRISQPRGSLDTDILSAIAVARDWLNEHEQGRGGRER